MLDKLPYQLTTGVTATQDGLELSDHMQEVVCAIGATLTTYCTKRDCLGYCLQWKTSWDWFHVSELLRYRQGEPGIVVQGGTGYLVQSDAELIASFDFALHRLAAILCDDADAFRVLHWCLCDLAPQQDDSNAK